MSVRSGSLPKKMSLLTREDLFLGPDDEVLIDADLAKLVLDDGDPLAVIGREDVFEEGGLPGPKEAGQDSDGGAGISRGHAAIKGKRPAHAGRCFHPANGPGGGKHRPAHAR